MLGRLPQGDPRAWRAASVTKDTIDHAQHAMQHATDMRARAPALRNRTHARVYMYARV